MNKPKPLAGAIKCEAVGFTNGIKDHPFLLSIVNEGFNDVDEKNKVCSNLERIR